MLAHLDPFVERKMDGVFSAFHGSQRQHSKDLVVIMLRLVLRKANMGVIAPTTLPAATSPSSSKVTSKAMIAAGMTVEAAAIPTAATGPS